jgi:hypothetical protein
MEIKFEFASYNSRRYTKPWGAKITFDKMKPEYDFSCARYFGDDNGGEVIVDCEPGDIVAVGQKDGRNPRNSERRWYIVSEGGDAKDTDQSEAYKHWQSRNLDSALVEERERLTARLSEIEALIGGAE